MSLRSAAGGCQLAEAPCEDLGGAREERRASAVWAGEKAEKSRGSRAAPDQPIHHCILRVKVTAGSGTADPRESGGYAVLRAGPATASATPKDRSRTSRAAPAHDRLETVLPASTVSGDWPVGDAPGRARLQAGNSTLPAGRPHQRR